MTPTPITRRTTFALVALLLPLAACGDSDDAGSSGSGQTGTAGTSNATASAAEGSIHLKVNGKEYDYPARQCRLVTTSDTNLSIDSDAISAMLPPQPGTFDDSVHARVLLPESLSDEPISSGLVHGTWSLDGETATGSLEGTAHTVISETQLAFTMDFTCPYAE